MRETKRTVTILIVVILSILTVIMMAPFFWMILSSFKTQTEIMRIPLKWFPDAFNFDNYVLAFGKYHFDTYYINTILVTIGIGIPQLYFSALAAYAFARLEFPFKNAIFMVLMTALMVPLQMIILPRYLMMIEFGWIDSLWGIIIPGIPSIFGTFFIRQNLMSLPKELDESAYLDGCSYYGVFSSILMPLCKPTMIAMGILTMTFAWNDLLWPLIVVNSQKRYTLAVGIAALQGQTNTPLNILLTGATLATIPIVIVFLIGQRYFLEGIASSGIKG